MENNLKILFIHSAEKMKEDSSGDLYTDGSYNTEVWKRYLKLTNDLTFICKKDKNIYDAEVAKRKLNFFPKEKIKTFFLEDTTQSLSSFISLSKRKKNKLILKNLIREADFIIIRMPNDVQDIAFKYIKKYKKDHVIELVGCPWDAYWNHSKKGKVLAPFYYLTTKVIVRNATNVVYVSRYFLQKRYPTQGNNVACPDVFLEEPQEYILQKRINKIKNYDKNTNFKLGLIGSLDVNYRGHETLLRALSELKKKNIICDVVFLGQGDSARWKNLSEDLDIEKQVYFSGTLPSGNLVLSWIDNIDILVMPTQQETLGRAIIEAMSRGCPIIGSIETAISEQIGSDCLIKAKDYNSLARLLEYMLNNHEYLTYCAYENYYRSYKYTNKQTESVRDKFFMNILNYINVNKN